jgi:hypothetical protein
VPKHVRVSAFARQLGLKVGLVLDALVHLGVTRKLTHQSSIDVELAERLRSALCQGNGSDMLRVKTILPQRPADSLKSDLAQPAPTSRVGMVPLHPTVARGGGSRSKPEPSPESTRAARTGPKYPARRTRVQGLPASALSKKYKFRCRTCGLGMNDADTLRRHIERHHPGSPTNVRGDQKSSPTPEQLLRAQAGAREAWHIKTASQAGLPSLGRNR